MGETVRQPRPRTTVAVIIPARYGSSRFPGKPLARLRDKPLIQHVYERVRPARGVSRIVVATDDARIPVANLRDRSAGGGGRVRGLRWKHLGISTFTKAAIAHSTEMASGSLEVAEQLEQLRLLETGVGILVWKTKQASLRVDPPAD